MLRNVSLLLLLTAACSVLAAQHRQIQRVLAPVERNGFAVLTSYDSLKAFLGSIARCPTAEVSTITSTRSGHSVFLVRYTDRVISSKDPTLRVLLFAQQHGDEPSGKEALTMLLARAVSGELKNVLRGIDLYIVPQMNPDGSERGERRTSEGIDLNRSHLLLNSPETAALHELFHSLQPQVTLDVHEYGPFSESWKAGGFIKRGDVQLGMLTNLNSSGALKEYQHKQVFPFIESRVAQAGFLFHEYIVGSPQDRVRHSTTEINDGRQSFGILNTLSFIQEGRNGETPAADLERRTRSQLAAIEALLEYCDGHAGEIRTLVASERKRLRNLAGSPFALRMEHTHGSGMLRIPVETLPENRDTVVTVSPYHDVVHALCETTVPQGYCIPASQPEVQELLRRHHVKMEIVKKERRVDVESLWIDSVGTDVLEEDTLPRPYARKVRETVVLKPGDVLVPTAQWHSLFLSTMLEPESMWGLTKYDKFGGLLKEKRYPISRIP